MIKIPNLKLVIMLEYQNSKIIFAKGYIPNWPEEFFVIEEVKNTVPLIYVFHNLHIEKIIETFHKNELQKTNQQGFRIEKVI